MQVTEPLTERDLELLSDLERLELPTLTWGIIDAALSEADVLGAIEDALDSAGDHTTSPTEVLQHLENHALVIRVEGEPPRFRTRFAEAVRLFARLRQIFPNHVRDRTWRAAPELVSDYRVLSRSRRFPRRDIDPREAIEEALAAARPGHATVSRAVLETLLGIDSDRERQLARFQAESLRHILRVVGEQRPTATMITAGTGSGKTLAFYLPAFVDAVTHIDATPWTKIVAVYPRVELLKDQLSEAVGHALRLRSVLRDSGVRPVRVGAFFRNTPYRTTDKIERWGWKPLGRESHISPFLLCWECGSPTTWPASYRTSGKEVLRCRDCGAETQPGDLGITRDGMRDNPPDILFTTTEMINRHLSSISYGHIFGVHRRVRPPRIALLDEAHAYSGVTGAQTALLLRRWQHAVGSPVHITGLSATLEDAQDFFARLTGVSESSVALVAPQEDELEDIGAEYLLALRGNPMSGTRLLSTTIQALMLLRRIEDVNTTEPTGGVFPPRVFAFTDDLDVTNRLYDYLLDAEGRSDFNRPRNDSLASLRRAAPPDLDERRRDGQIWDLPARIGHPLSGSTISISRTSSRDVGVNESSDIVVATASLEVGFDDVRVGGILQHKAPKGSAAFIQRRGRAGRLIHSRPWAVVVLSDFGRDRRAYQAFETLFEPVLRPSPLPIDNRHVVKIQAAYALLDWLSVQMADEGDGTLWGDLAQPQDTATPWGKAGRKRQVRAAALLRSVLEDPREEQRLAEHLQRALAVSIEEAAVALWENPNGLMLSVVPTLLRRLETTWRNVNPPPATDRFGRDPLPEHVPPNLFSDLNAPEVELTLAGRQGTDTSEALPIAQALRELTPGRVTRRFSREDERRARHWVPLPADGSGDVDVVKFLLDYRELGNVATMEDGVALRLPCLRPWSARLEVPDKQIEDSQSGILRWASELSRPDESILLDLPSANPWQTLVTELDFYTHSTRTEVEITRFTVGGEAAEPGHPEQSRVIRFVRQRSDDVERVALGYGGTYDAIRLLVQVPVKWELPEGARRALRRRYFDSCVQESAALADRASVFSRSWLAILYRSAITATAAINGISGADARDRLRQVGIPAALEKAMRVIFEVTATDAGPNQADTRAERRLLDLLHASEVTDELHALGAVLIAAELPPNDFIVTLYRTTAAAAFKDAFATLAPTVNADTLLVDLPTPIPESTDGCVEVWLSEPSVGGGGVVEQLLAAAAGEPRRLLTLAETAVGESIYEQIDASVARALRLAQTDSAVGSAFASYRQSVRAAEVRESFLALQVLLRERGVAWNRSIGATLATRVLRPGSSPATDALILELHERWDAIESLSGFEADARVIAFALRNELDVGSATGLTPPPDLEEAWRFSQLYGLLWPRGFEARTATLDAFTPFAWLPEPERLVVAPLLNASRSRVDVSTEDWRLRVDEHLARDGVAVLVVPASVNDRVKAVLLDLASRPTDLGFLHAYPRVVGVTNSFEACEISLELDETL